MAAASQMHGRPPPTKYYVQTCTAAKGLNTAFYTLLFLCTAHITVWSSTDYTQACLTATQPQAALADDGVVLLREAVDDGVVQRRGARRIRHLLIAGLWPPIPAQVQPSVIMDPIGTNSAVNVPHSLINTGPGKTSVRGRGWLAHASATPSLDGATAYCTQH